LSGEEPIGHPLNYANHQRGKEINYGKEEAAPIGKG
jgi:hypothetical protein